MTVKRLRHRLQPSQGPALSQRRPKKMKKMKKRKKTRTKTTIQKMKKAKKTTNPKL